MGTRFYVHIVFVSSVASKNVNGKIKAQTSSPSFVGGYMVEIQLFLLLSLFLQFGPEKQIQRFLFDIMDQGVKIITFSGLMKVVP